MPSLFLHVLPVLGIITLTTGQEQLLMVFGGQFGEVPTLFPKYRDVHLLSLDGGPPLPWCLQSLNKFPINLWESCPATLGNGRLPRTCSKTLLIFYHSVSFHQAGKLPHVCGGRYAGCDVEELPYPCDAHGYNDLCYRYDPGYAIFVI